MEREGMFYVSPNSHTSNQCKAEGHKHYKYTAKIVFSHKATLDSNHFLIDHQEIDDTIIRAGKRGSCEQYHNKIMDSLLEMFAKKEIPIIAIRVTIFPVNPAGQAVLTKTWLYDLVAASSLM